MLPYVSLFRNEELAALLEEYPCDIGSPAIQPPGEVDAEYQEHLRVLTHTGSYTDSWGCVWEVGEPGVVGEVKHPPLADWAALDTFQPPWNVLMKRDLSHANRFCEASDKFMMSSESARPFERIQFLRGTENVFMDLASDEPEIHKLIEMVHEYNLKDVSAWATSNVDGIFFMDDWGSNQALLIDPEMWRAIFKPLYRDYCRIIHDAGKFAFFHSDGNIASIYPDLIEVGVDAVNSQLFCMDIEELGRRHKGKITFWGEIDRQRVLPFGTPEDVGNAVRRVRSALADESGGVIAQCEWGKDNLRENIEAVFEAWL